MTASDLGGFLNHQINVVSGVSCAATMGPNEGGLGCVHCGRNEKKRSKSGVSDSLVTGVLESEKTSGR